MKITRHKLNSLLRSGLRPEISTRKQLAKVLNLDPTSLTRWFASHDRLGNPRFPVVPDRHVNAILRLFNVQLADLNLSDEDFKQFCFDKALSNPRETTKLLSKTDLPAPPQTQHLVISTATARPKQNKYASWFALSACTLLAFTLTVRSDLKIDSLYRLNQMITASPSACWNELDSNGLSSQAVPRTFYPIQFTSGFPSSVEASARCAYPEILEQGLSVLNKNPTPQLDGAHNLVDLLAFVNKKIGDSQTERKAALRFEMGRKEIRNQQLQKASGYFLEAHQLLATLPNYDEKLFRDLSTYASLANYGDNPWWYARQLSDSSFLHAKSKKPKQGESWRRAARADAEIGRISLSAANIDRALRLDSQNLGYDHPVMASNWLLKSQILNLQGELKQAREYAHRAIVLDTYLFGENHSRVAQDKMHLAMIILQEGRLSEAKTYYQAGYDFFSQHPFSNHSVLKSGDKFLQSLASLQAEKDTPHRFDSVATQEQAWAELRQSLMEHDFMLPRCLTTAIWQRLLNQQIQSGSSKPLSHEKIPLTTSSQKNFF